MGLDFYLVIFPYGLGIDWLKVKNLFETKWIKPNLGTQLSCPPGHRLGILLYSVARRHGVIDVFPTFTLVFKFSRFKKVSVVLSLQQLHQISQLLSFQWLVLGTMFGNTICVSLTWHFGKYLASFPQQTTRQIPKQMFHPVLYFSVAKFVIL